jgi:hypothetical protein
MKRVLSAATLAVAALHAQAAPNNLSAELRNVTISFTDLDPLDAHVPVTSALWRDTVDTARYSDAPTAGDFQQVDATAWADRSLASGGSYADGSASAALAFSGGVGTLAVQLSHEPQPGPSVLLNAGATRSVPVPLNWSDPTGLLVIAPHTAVSLSADYLLSYRFDAACFSDGACPVASVVASLSMSERFNQDPQVPRFDALDERRIALGAQNGDTGMLSKDETGSLSITFANDTDAVRYALLEVGVGLGLGMQAAAPVPEPASGALLLAGLAGLGALGRRRAATMRRCPPAPPVPTPPSPATSARA